MLQSCHSFWYSLFFQNTNVDDIATLNQALFLGYLPSYNYCVYIFEMMNASAYFQKLEAMHGPSFTETSSEFFRMLATKLSYITQKETGSTWHVARNSANVFVLPINTNSQEQSADRFFESLTIRMEQQYPGTKILLLEKAMSVHVFLAFANHIFRQNEACFHGNFLVTIVI